MKISPSIPAALLALALWQAPARADVADADRATARALTLEGYEALDRKDYAAAADRFGRADALYHVATVALGLAHAQVGLGRLVSALATYSRVVREGVPRDAPPAFVRAVDDARREIDALAQRIPSVVIVVHGTGADAARVTLDGIEVPSAALGVKRTVDPGSHVVRVSAPGATPSEATITLLEARVETVTIDLQPAPVSPVAPIAPSPIAAAPVSSTGPAAASNATASPPAAEPSVASGRRLAGFVTLGVGAAGLGLGAIAGGVALSKHSALLDACPGGRCPSSQKASLQSDLDAYHHLGGLSTAGFVVGGAALGAGIVLLVTARNPAPEPSVTPVIGLGYAGAQGRF